jgi:4'-phosphopantetheinyl transferase
MAQRGVSVHVITTPNTNDRHQARQRVRSALTQLLQRHDPKRPAPHITSTRGAALRLAPPWHDTHVSFSHEAGLSLIAIAPCAIGVDVLRLDAHTLPEGETATLARDYLGPAAADALSKLQGQERRQHFAHAWAAHEARLKCAGIPLTEWSADMARQLAPFVTLYLDLPAPYLGALSLPRGS